MKRRGFLSFLGLSGGVIASGASIAMPESERGIFMKLDCVNKNCGQKWQLFVDLTKPITFGSPQCPHCCQVMPFPQDSAQQIKEWHLARGNKTDIYTPKYG